MHTILYDNDQEVINGLQRGEERAFNAIYEQLHKRLYYFALRFVPDHDARDVVAEAFAAVWEKRADFAQYGQVQHYLFVTVRNKCLKLLKHELVKMRNQDALLHRLATMGEADFDMEPFTEELIRYIYAEVDRLPPRMREVFLLSFREGLKPAAIAERLQLSVKTVRNQKVTAIQLLRSSLGDRAHLLSLLLLLYSES